MRPETGTSDVLTGTRLINRAMTCECILHVLIYKIVEDKIREMWNTWTEILIEFIVTLSEVCT
jgi:hypothetical protein